MQNRTWTPGAAIWRVAAGPVEAHLLPFRAALSKEGYSPLSVADYLRSAAHFGVWLEVGGLDLPEVTDAVVDGFRQHLCRCRGAAKHGRPVSRRYVARVCRFVAFARESGAIAARPVIEVRDVHPLLNGFERWTSPHGGLRPRTVRKYMRGITTLLPMLGEDPRAYNAALMRQVVQRLATRRTRSSAKCLVTALKAFLRFLLVKGDCAPDLIQAVPTLPQWRLSALPRYLDKDKLEPSSLPVQATPAAGCETGRYSSSLPGSVSALATSSRCPWTTSTGRAGPCVCSARVGER